MTGFKELIHLSLVEAYNILAKGNYEEIFGLVEKLPPEDKLEIDLVMIWIYIDYYEDMNSAVKVVEEVLKKEYSSEKDKIIFYIVKATESVFVLKRYDDAKNFILEANSYFDLLSKNKKEELKH